MRAIACTLALLLGGCVSGPPFTTETTTTGSPSSTPVAVDVPDEFQDLLLVAALGTEDVSQQGLVAVDAMDRLVFAVTSSSMGSVSPPSVRTGFPTALYAGTVGSRHVLLAGALPPTSGARELVGWADLAWFDGSGWVRDEAPQRWLGRFPHGLAVQGETLVVLMQTSAGTLEIWEWREGLWTSRPFEAAGIHVGQYYHLAATSDSLWILGLAPDNAGTVWQISGGRATAHVLKPAGSLVPDFVSAIGAASDGVAVAWAEQELRVALGPDFDDIQRLGLERISPRSVLPAGDSVFVVGNPVAAGKPPDVWHVTGGDARPCGFAFTQLGVLAMVGSQPYYKVWNTSNGTIDTLHLPC
jgi:hypothetical protein